MNLIVVADTGAVISLVLSGMFRICQQHFRIISGEKIAEELKEISLEDDDLGKAAKEALNEIEIVSAGKKFDIGEDEALELLGKKDHIKN